MPSAIRRRGETGGVRSIGPQSVGQLPSYPRKASSAAGTRIALAARTCRNVPRFAQRVRIHWRRQRLQGREGARGEAARKSASVTIRLIGSSGEVSKPRQR